MTFTGAILQLLVLAIFIAMGYGLVQILAGPSPRRKRRRR